MIYDSLQRIDEYKFINPHVNRALDFLKSRNLKDLKLGKHTIDGDNVFALIIEYDTHPILEGRWEAHRKYYDIQFLIEGNEIIAISDISKMTVTESYNEEGDYELFSGEGRFFEFSENDFIILRPHEVHQPGILNTEKAKKVKKIVVKALI